MSRSSFDSQDYFVGGGGGGDCSKSFDTSGAAAASVSESTSSAASNYNYKHLTKLGNNRSQSLNNEDEDDDVINQRKLDRCFSFDEFIGQEIKKVSSVFLIVVGEIPALISQIIIVKKSILRSILLKNN